MYVTLTDGWNRPIPPALYWFFAAFTAWWTFLTIRSGVVPSRGLGPAIYRDTNPLLFWCAVAVTVLMSACFGFLATMMGQMR